MGIGNDFMYKPLFLIKYGKLPISRRAIHGKRKIRISKWWTITQDSVLEPLLFGFFHSNFNRSRDRDNPRLYGGVMADITELPKFPSIVKGLSGYPIINCFVRMVSIGRIVWGSGMGFV